MAAGRGREKRLESVEIFALAGGRDQLDLGALSCIELVERRIELFADP